MRVVEHPILDELDTTKEVTIYCDGQPITALEGEPIAAALMNAGIRSFRTTPKRKEKRGIFCAIGRYTHLCNAGSGWNVRKDAGGPGNI